MIGYITKPLLAKKVRVYDENIKYLGFSPNPAPKA
jgi:hypothetical protein